MKMKDVYFLSTISDLRKLGTTNFFKIIKDLDSEGVVIMIRKESNEKHRRECVKFIPAKSVKSEERGNKPTVTDFLKSIKIRDASQDSSIKSIESAIKACGGIIRAKVVDSATSELEYFKVVYLEDFQIDYDKAILFTENQSTYTGMKTKYDNHEKRDKIIAF